MRVFIVGGVTAGRGNPDQSQPEREMLNSTCVEIGKAIAHAGYTAVVCSPFEDSADYQILRGVALGGGAPVEVHFPDTVEVQERLAHVVSELSLRKVIHMPHPPPRNAGNPGAPRYAWLLCQLEALDSSHAVIAIGGRPDGAANMLLLVADGRRMPVLPVSFLGGAAEQAFYRRRYELEDRLESEVDVLQDAERVAELLPLVARLAAPRRRNAAVANRLPMFFISYPRARPTEADQVEAVLRRRNLPVFRDESELGAGHEIPAQIREAVHRADVFIALWCREYACSPWCADELELALERRAAGKLNLWIFCVDDTRIVPRGARDLLNYRIDSRKELEGHLVTLIEGLGSEA